MRTIKRKVRGNGQGTVFKLPNGKWRAEVTLGWSENKRKVKTKSGFIRKKDALDYLETLRCQLPGIDTNIVFSKLYELWSVPHYAKKTCDTINGYKAAYRHCENLWYKIFNQIKTSDLQEVVDACTLSRRTKADIKSLLNNMYSYAIENDYCVKNYAEFVKLPPKGKSDHDAFTKEERDILWKAYNNGDKFIGEILFMIYCGLRFGEYKILKKEKMHLDEHYFIGGIKTKAGIDRTVPIADCIFSIAEELYNKLGNNLLTVHEKVWYHLYHSALINLGIRDLDAHCCRHTCATALAEAGVPTAVIKTILGHEDYATTLGYTHMSLEELLKGVNAQYTPSSSSE